MLKEITKNVKSSSKVSRPVALITGASSGIGLELAHLFARDGYDLVLIARNQASLDRLGGEIHSEHEIQVTVIAQDLADPLAPQVIYDQRTHRSIEVEILVNKAGTQVYGAFHEASLEQLLELIQVNSIALMHLTHLLLPGMIRQGHGQILNVGSTGSFVPGPLNAVYCATKAFVLSFSQAVGAELAGTGVTVTTLCPGATKTAFITRHGMQDVRIFRKTMPAKQVAEAGYKSLQRRRPLVVPGLGNQIQVLSFQLMAPFLSLTPPALLNAIGKRFMGRMRTDVGQKKFSQEV